MLNDRDLSKLSQHIGGDWELVLLDLGLTPVDISHAKMENPNTIPMQVFSALHKWKMRKPATATLGNFLQACMNCQCVTINWNKIQMIVQQMN